ncbi:11521_t:CDS:2 [Entrophospora sp. SA101]|nr:11521_t:CDS:2 [Entrophospora sp. SA101]
MKRSKAITLRIKNTQGQTIVGVLERKFDEINRNKLGIICHGILVKLAKVLPFDTFRLDFRGNGESDGVPKFSNIEEDAEDIITVYKYLEKVYGYSLYTLIGHSRGALAALYYASTINLNIPYLVLISGRFRMQSLIQRFNNEQLRDLEKKGWTNWTSIKNGKGFAMKITKKEFDHWMNWDTTTLGKIPNSTSVLVIHGTADEVVPVEDSAIYNNIIHNSTLRLISGATHNFTRHKKEIVNIINKYFSQEYQSFNFLYKNQWISHIPRYIQIDGVSNFRDLERYVFRCGEEIEGITRTHVPVFKEIDFSPQEVYERSKLYVNGYVGYAKAYLAILEEGKEAYRQIFLNVLNKPDIPFAVHCKAGKDRTGVFAMLILKLCGINDEIVAREYEITDFNTRGIYTQKFKYYDKYTDSYYNEEEIRSMLSAR